MRRAGCLIMVLVLLFGCLPALAADETQIGFTAGSPDANGCFTLTMSMSSATFNVFQLAVRFDPSVIEPVDVSGARTNDFFAFAKKEAQWISTVGCSVNADTGFMGFTGYISPGEAASVITNGEAVIGTEPVTMFTFRFKTLKSGDPQMKIALEELGEPYEHAFPQGAGVMGREGESPVRISFDMSALEGGGVTAEMPKTDDGGTAAPPKTVESLLGDCLILKIDSFALVAEGGATAFYPGERSVVPFIDASNRTFVPLRFVAEKLGAKVEWFPDTNTAVITGGGTEVRMSIGSAAYTVNGVEKTMDAAPQLVSSAPGQARTMVPIRFVAEALGMTVEWDAGHRFVIIAPGGFDWDTDGETEKEALEKANVLLLMYGGFV